MTQLTDEEWFASLDQMTASRSGDTFVSPDREQLLARELADSEEMYEAAEPVGPVKPVVPVTSGGVEVTGTVLDDTRGWLARFVCTMTDGDLDLLTLWAAHTHLVMETYTSPRLVLDSPVPGSGKTTVLEHLERLCLHPIQMASLSSPALLTRMLDAGMRTILIDEADRSLNPDKEGVAELLAVLNSGYKRGGTRPVLVPRKDGWQVSEMPTYSPVAMAGNNPQLPEDTRSRTIRVLLMPDIDGRVEESDWELIDDDARVVGEHLAAWADSIRDDVRLNRPPLPEGIKGRARERWAPLKRIATAAGGRWPGVVDALAIHDKEQQEMDREDGLIRERPHVALLKHLHEMWIPGEPFMETATILRGLIVDHPDDWGIGSPFGKPLTAQRMGKMLATGFGINSGRLSATTPRGYTRSSLESAWRRMGITADLRPGASNDAPEPVTSTPPEVTGTTGLTGPTGTPSAAARFAAALDASVARPSCRNCGQDLLIHPERGQCERCRLADERESA